MIRLDEPENERECFILALIEALASPIVPWKKDIQRNVAACPAFYECHRRKAESCIIESAGKQYDVISAEAGIK